MESVVVVLHQAMIVPAIQDRDEIDPVLERPLSVEPVVMKERCANEPYQREEYLQLPDRFMLAKAPAVLQQVWSA